MTQNSLSPPEKKEQQKFSIQTKQTPIKKITVYKALKRLKRFNELFVVLHLLLTIAENNF